jgi:hypothetical protein
MPGRRICDTLPVMDGVLTLKRAVVLVGMASALFMPATVSAHPLQPGGPISVATQPVSPVVLMMLGALGLFVLIVSGATLVRLTMHRRRQPLAARMEALLTTSMAGCAVVALVAFVVTQFIPFQF